MNKLFPASKIYISQSKISKAGRGVFAQVIINEGEIIESCPIIEISEYDSPRINETMLVSYIYFFGKNKQRQVITLGFGSIYNHSYTPNAHYKSRLSEKIIDFIAIKEIKKDEEITVNYNHGDSKEKRPLWFEVR